MENFIFCAVGPLLLAHRNFLIEALALCARQYTHHESIAWTYYSFEYVCVCLRPFTMKDSSFWISWNARKQLNDVVLKTFVSYATPFIVTLEWSTKPF